MNPAFRMIDAALRFCEPQMPKGLRQKAIDCVVAWVKERLNGEEGLGAIYPAMANAVMMYDCLGYKPDHPDAAIARRAINKMVIDGASSPARSATPATARTDSAYCQPCLSPVWDTGLACHALEEAGADASAIEKGCDWLAGKQILDVMGDWATWRPGVRPGGWAFQYANAHYPDLDDTAMVVMALDRLDRDKYRKAIDRGVEWVLGLQSKNGGWGAFDAENTYHYLNYIPFADHGALLDPPSADVTARCLSMLGQLGYSKEHPAVKAALKYLRHEQEPEGCWFGRWGTNYIYGTWSVLCALNAIGVNPKDEMVWRAADWLLSKQRDDGGWGEDGASYWEDKPKGEGPESTPAQTAWSLLGLMAAGEVDHPAVGRGIKHLLETQNEDNLWDEEYYSAVGFPRVFYLRYHGYKAFFPLWAVARYRNLQQSNAPQVLVGM